MTEPTREIGSEARAEALEAVNRRPVRVLRLFWEWAKSVQLAILLFLLLRAFVVEAFKIPSGSMEGTLLVGDFLLVNKLVYGAEVPFTHKRLSAVREPARGDVVVFLYPPDPSKNFVKRLIGLPGDTLSMNEGVVTRNGQVLREPYVTHSDPGGDTTGEDFQWQNAYLVRTAQAAPRPHPSRNNWGPLVVPPRHYFMLGDNRDNSLDSRYWGFVADTLVRGTPLVVYYSFVPDSSRRAPWLTRIRWGRLGTRIH